MKGTVIKRGKKWSVVIDLGRDPVTGKRRRSWHSGFERKKDAERARVEILSRLQSGQFVEPSRQSLGEFLLNQWLPARRANLSPTTFENYRIQVEAYILPHLGSRPLQALQPSELNAFYARLLEDGQRQGKGGLSPKSVKNVHGVLRRALEDATRWNLIARNPAAQADPPHAKRREMKTWQPDEVRAFLEAERGTGEYPIWVLAARTGMRRGELLGLSNKATDLDVGRLSVTQTLVVVGGTPTLRQETKTAAGRRSIELDSHTVAVLKHHWKRQLEERMIAGAAWRSTDLVFTNQIGENLRPDWLSRTFARRVAAAGLPKIRFHDLRHTWASIAVQAGIHPKIVSERLGHSNIGITLDTYSHVVPAMDRQAAEEVAALISISNQKWEVSE